MLHPLKHLALLSSLLVIAACGSPPVQCKKPAEKSDVVYVVEQGWHAEIGIPVSELDEDMEVFADIFPGAKVIMFGYGKKTFFTAPAASFSEYVIGPFPGAAVIHAVGLNVTPLKAYPPEYTTLLHLPPGGAHSLSAFIWADLTKDEKDKLKIVARSKNPDGLFYAANSRYNLLHTCNTWTADALQDAGLPISGGGVMFAGQVMSQVEKSAARQCQKPKD